jgi:hypothetical protein
LSLSKRQAELLASGLKGWNFLHPYTEICFFRNYQSIFKEIFSEENDLVLCNDVFSVIEALGHQHDPTEWSLFIDSSKVSSVDVLLQTSNPRR